MGRTIVVLVLGVFATLGLAPYVTPAAAKRTPCAGGRFVVQGGPLLPGAPASQVDVLTLVGQPANADLGIGCTLVNLKRPARLRATKRGTKVQVIWKDCAGFAGAVRLNGTIVDDCKRLDGSLRAKGFKRTIQARATTCGDGFVDAANAEGCEAGVACAGGGVCAIDCTCMGPTTTSTVTTSTTTTTLPGTCNPLAAPGSQGCAAGQKCTWVTVQDMPTEIGLLGCVPAGAVQLDGSCTQGPAGETTGYDDCAAGLVCVAGTCHDVCGFDGTPDAACAVGFSCTRYAGLFANGDDDPVAGACNEGCNPITQLRFGGMPCGDGLGCYLLTNQTDTISVCASAGSLTHGQEITGPAFANSCAPGHQPRRRDQATQVFECGALCQMVDVYMGTNESSEGGVSPYTCASKGAAPPSDVMAGESCRYFWAREPFDTPPPVRNTVGWSFKHAVFQYDTNGDMVNDAAFPRCTTLTTGDVVPPIGNPPHNDAQYFWCTALPAQLVAHSVGESAVMKPPHLDWLGGWR